MMDNPVHIENCTCHMGGGGGCHKCGPLMGTLKTKGRGIQGTQKKGPEISHTPVQEAVQLSSSEAATPGYTHS